MGLLIGNAEKVVKIRTPNRRGFWTVRSQPLKDHQMFGSTLVSSSDQVVVRSMYSLKPILHYAFCILHFGNLKRSKT